MGDDSEWLKLPADEKCVHKVWKARVAGYEEATKLFQTLGEEKSPEFSKYLGIVKKLVVDNNAIAQEKALDAVLAFVENAAVAGRTAGEVLNGVITKCLNASRTKTKEKGVEIILMYIEIEKQEVVQDELMKGLTNKQPKVVAGCVAVLREALRDFGSKVIAIKPLVKQIQRLLEDRDKTVREEGKHLVVEIYRWIGAALKPQLANLKPVQITELEAEFENIAPGSARQTKFLRSQQDLKAKMEEQAAAAEEGGACGGAAADVGAVAEEIDPYDLMDPVDILSKIPKDYYDKIEAKKWQDRKEVLEAVQKLAEYPKIEQGDFHDLVKTLKKVVAKDTNVMLVAIGAKCIAALATGLRKKFSSYAAGCIDVILEKFKEKKPAVVAALREAVDATYQTTTLDSISEICIEALGHKTPTVKTETASFLARCFARATPASLPKKMLKAFVAPLLKTINDTAPEVREASFNAVGTAMKVVGEKPIASFLADVDPLKMAKIKEYCDKAELIGKNGQPRGGGASAAAPAAAPAPAAKTAAPAKSGVRPGAKSKSDSSASSSDGPGPSKSAGSARPKTAPGKSGGGAKKAGKGKKDEKEEKIETHLSDDVIEERATLLLPAESITGLSSANWKERLSAIEKLTQVIKGLSKEEIPAQVCVRVVAKKPGLKENNFQVLKLKIDLLAHLASNSNFSKTSASFCLSDLVDKVGDVKNGAGCQETLSCIAESTSLEFVCNEVITLAFAQKNPKNQSESLNWLAKALKEFGFKVQVKPLVECLKKALGATNPAVRTAAISVLSVMYMYMGQTLRMLFDGEKAALLQQIDAEFEKVKGEKPPTPFRGAVAAAAGAEEEEDEEEDGEGKKEGINIADLIPRNDINDQLKLEILEEMADKNWKVRNEALQKIMSILNEAKFITPNIGSLPEALKLRLADSNKILMGTALNICQTLATAMGPNIKQHIRIIGPGIVGCLGDGKPALRLLAVATLNGWLEQTGQQGFLQFIEAEIFSDELKKENPNLRSELLGWLAEKLPTYRKLPSELNMCTPYLYSCLEDRNAEVRKKAQEAVLPFMIHLGYDSMVKQVGKLKPSSKDQVMGILEKARPNLPAKPVKTKAAPPKTTSVAARPASPSSSSPSEMEDEAERPSIAPAKAGGKGKGKAPAGKKPAAAAATARTKKKDDEDAGPPLKANNKGKEQRCKDEKAMKTLKWNFTTPRGEYIDQLKTQMDPTFSKTLIEQLFHADFKNHLKAIDTLTKVKDECTTTIANLDLILKWVTLRFFDTNTSVLLKALEYIKEVFVMLSAQDYHLTEQEAIAFVPYLIIKVGDPKDNIRRSIREMFKLVCKVYPASKMFSYIIDGLKSKNSKQRTECLEELGILIEVYGINVCQPAPAQALKLIAQQIGDRDNSVRSAALNTIVCAHCILGDTVHKYVGMLNDKDAGMLEERIKRSTRTRPPPPVPTNKSPSEEKPNKNNRVIQTQEQPREPEVRSAPKRHSQLLLDFEEAEETIGKSDFPDFIEHDIDDVLYDPIKMPETKTRMRPPSPSVKLVQSSADTKSALDLVISQVASNEIDTSIQALAQIDYVLKDNQKSDTMASHTDQFLVACTLQIRMIYSKHMSEANMDAYSVIRLYKCLLGSMLALFECKNLAKDASRDVLRDLIHNFITILLDNRLNDMAEGPQIVRSVNIMVVKIVEKSDTTSIMSALIKLLHDTVETETSSTKYLDLVMKGLWKMVRMLPEIINDLNISHIIRDMHAFLKAFPGHTWKQRPNDMPMRTIKTILHSLAKLKGPKIMNHLDLVDISDGQTSEIETYLRRILKNGLDPTSVAKVNKQNEQMNGSAEVELRKDRKEGAKSQKRLSKTTHDMLAEIFKKIGSKENTREGLNDLYDFKQKYPEADLDPFLKKSSQFFQSYIERGLKNIEIEREGKTMKTSASAPNMSTGSNALSLATTASTTTQPSQDDMSASMYRERLKVLRARCGLDNSSTDNLKSLSKSDVMKARAAQLDGQGSNSSLSSDSSSGGGLSFKSNNSLNDESAASENVNSNISINADRSGAPTQLNDLRKRLQRIKKASHSQN